MAISDENDRLTIIISKKMKNELKQLADLENRSLSNYIVNVLEQHLDNLGQLSLNLENDKQEDDLLSDEVENGTVLDLNSPQIKAIFDYINNVTQNKSLSEVAEPNHDYNKHKKIQD